MGELTHIDADGRARMVDVSDKAVTTREARAEGRLVMQPETLALALSGGGRRPASGGRTGRPQSRSSGDPEAAERPGGGQRLGLRHRQLHPSGQIGESPEGAVRFSFLDQELREVGADMADVAQPQPHLQARVFQCGVREAGVHVGPMHDDAVPAGIGDQRLR